MNIPDEAARVFPDGGYTSHGVNAALREAFSMGAEWARKEALREADGRYVSIENNGWVQGVHWTRGLAEGVSDGQQ